MNYMIFSFGDHVNFVTSPDFTFIFAAFGKLLHESLKRKLKRSFLLDENENALREEPQHCITP